MTAPRRRHLIGSGRRPTGAPPDIGRALWHLLSLRRHLLAVDHPGEAAAVANIIEMLRPAIADRGPVERPRPELISRTEPW